ncbi:MAG: carbohydrate porin [Arenicella sp.]
MHKKVILKTKLNLAIACGIATMGVATTVNAADTRTFNVGGDVELDITGSQDDAGNNFDHGGRIKIDVNGMVVNDNGHFVKGVAQPLVLFNPGDQNVLIEQDTEDSVIDNSSATVDSNSLEVDDLYLQFGKTESWDIKIGRFEAANLLPLGKDTLVVNAGGVQVYDAGSARGRIDDRLHAALNISLGANLQFELGIQANKSGDDEETAIRPVITYTIGAFKLHAGYENIEKSGVDDDNGIGSDIGEDGFGLGFGTKVFGGDLNLSVASLDDGNGTDVNTLALNYTKGAFGIGYIHSGVHNDNVPEDPTVDTLYAAYTMPLLSIEGASVTFALSTSEADNVNGVDDSLQAARVRFNYGF